MAITSVGFAGTVGPAAFARMSQYQGAAVPIVAGKNDLAVAANPSATLACTVQAGSSAGQGVITTSDSVESVTFDAVTTNGQSRWDAVVLRRDWSAGTASLIVVKGTAAASAPQVLPSGVDTLLDTNLDHVLALVQITYGSTVPTSVVDRRLQAHKAFTAPSVAALPAPTVGLYGMEAVVGASRYRCVSDAGGQPTWKGTSRSASNVVSPATGWTVVSTLEQRDSSVHLYVQATRTGAAIAGGASGNIANSQIGSLAAGFPLPLAPTAATVYGGPIASCPLTTGGLLYLGAIAPNYTFPQGGVLQFQFFYLTNNPAQ